MSDTVNAVPETTKLTTVQKWGIAGLILAAVCALALLVAGIAALPRTGDLPTPGVLSFEIQVGDESAEELHFGVLSFDAKGDILADQRLEDRFPLLWTVIVPSTAVNVTIYVVGVKSISCLVVWKGQDGSQEVYNQTSKKENAATTPRCDWRRGMKNGD